MNSSEVSIDDFSGPGGFTSSLGTVTNIVDCSILGLTILGAGAVMIAILHKEYNVDKGSTIRSRLVLFLVFGDLVLGIIGIIPTIGTLSGNPPATGSSFCDATGFLLAATLWAQHFNTLALAVATYLILIYPLSSWTALVERRWRWSLPLVWILSFVMSAVAWAVQESWAYNAGLCFYEPGLFGVIYQFIPRGVVFTTITVLYFRLFIFLRRPDKIRSSTSLQGRGRSTSAGSTGLDSTGSKLRRHTLAAVKSVRGSIGLPDRSHSVGTVGQSSRISEGDEATASTASAPRRKSSAGGMDMEEVNGGPKDMRKLGSHPGGSSDVDESGIPQWERLELPTFEGAGLDGPSTTPIPSGWTWGLKKGGGGVFGGAGEGAGSKGLGGNPTPNLSLLKPPLPPPPKQPSLKRQSSFALPGSPRLDPMDLSPRRNSDTPMPDLSHDGWGDRVEDEPTVAHSGARRGSRVSFVDSHFNQLGISTPIHPRSHSPAPTSEHTLAPSTTVPSTFQFPPSSPATTPFFTPLSSSLSPFNFPSSLSSSSPPTTHRSSSHADSFTLSSFTQPSSTTHTEPIELSLLKGDPSTTHPDPSHPEVHSSKSNTYSSNRRSSEGTGSSRLTKETEQNDRATDQPLEDEDDENMQWSLEKILEMTQPPTKDHGSGERTWEPREYGSGEGTGSGSDGANQESMARFMNRKASLLMLSFPLAYVVLFSVSLIRIIYDFTSDTPIPALSAISRWFVFSQGLADALIYGLIEWKVKRSVRRRTRAGHFSSSFNDSNSNSRNAGI
ncbi:hypothetical protein BDY24DRAFT_397460 [Mrakia frigida]|uniref:G-protein coupled receptor n=1 Tax=Mrakia frigida TaxID=29902 RepID=UPI003FCC1F51